MSCRHHLGPLIVEHDDPSVSVECALCGTRLFRISDPADRRWERFGVLIDDACAHAREAHGVSVEITETLLFCQLEAEFARRA